MGKKSTSEIISHWNFRDGELFLRMNFLLKLSDKTFEKNKTLSKIYSTIMEDISIRNAIKIDKNLKRLICKRCNNLLYKDKQTKIKLINQAGKKMICYTCNNCKEKSKIIININK